MEPPETFCPACQEKVAPIAATNGQTCPKCGRTFGVGQTAPSPAAPAPVAQVRTTWWVLLAALLAPAVMAFLGALARSESLSAASTFFGSGAAALFGAFWLGSRLNLQVSLRIVVALLLAPVFYVACVALCFAGCALSGGINVGG